jgi:uncharacterized protein (TIGR01319 family)
LCVDVGSTFTKAALVDVSAGRLLRTAARPTTLASDVMDAVRACAADLSAEGTPMLCCSSAGGGLRIAVIGNEQLVTAEAGRHVALSSGGHVVAVLAGGLDATAITTLRESEPDVVLLVGGTDGGNAEMLLADARTLAGWHTPVVFAGNREAAREAAEVLEAGGTTCQAAANVMPRIGTLTPEPARAALRQVFLDHVIGGKGLSIDKAFLRRVRGATPDVVLRAVELLAQGPTPGEGVGEVVVVDVGGATTDVYSVVERAADVEPDGGGSREVLGARKVTRTVEGDLGVRGSALGTVAAAIEAGWVDDVAEAVAAAERRRRDPGFIARDAVELETDVRLAGWALALAVRRHAGRARPRYEATGPGRGVWLERTGVDLRQVRLVVGSGGVLRHAVGRDPASAQRFVAHLDAAGGWQLPRDAAFAVDADYVWAAAGLLAEDQPDVAWSLLASVRGDVR